MAIDGVGVEGEAEAGTVGNSDVAVLDGDGLAVAHLKGDKTSRGRGVGERLCLLELLFLAFLASLCARSLILSSSEEYTSVLALEVFDPVSAFVGFVVDAGALGLDLGVSSGFGVRSDLAFFGVLSSAALIRSSEALRFFFSCSS